MLPSCRKVSLESRQYIMLEHFQIWCKHERIMPTQAMSRPLTLADSVYQYRTELFALRQAFLTSPQRLAAVSGSPNPSKEDTKDGPNPGKLFRCRLVALTV